MSVFAESNRIIQISEFSLIRTDTTPSRIRIESAIRVASPRFSTCGMRIVAKTLFSEESLPRKRIPNTARNNPNETVKFTDLLCISLFSKDLTLYSNVPSRNFGLTYCISDSYQKIFMSRVSGFILFPNFPLLNTSLLFFPFPRPRKLKESRRE